MKRLIIIVITAITLFGFNIDVFAASGSLSVSSNSVYVGDSFTVSANINSAAAWNVHVSASGPVSGCSINQADATADAMDTNKTFSATCTATGEGTITIRLSGDVTSASDGNAVVISGSQNVTVSKKVTPPSNNNNNNNTNNNNNNSNSNNTNSNVDNKSTNNNIKELKVDGYELTKVDTNNYTLIVPNDVSSINVKATAEDSKASITGAGNHNLNIGENNIEIVVTSESGAQNKINIKVTRKDGYYLEDLESVLKNNKISDINIIINSDTKISSKDLEKIKNSKKTVKFNYNDENKNLLYSWIVNGAKLNDTNEFITTISYNSENKKEMLRLSNYADSLFISLKQISNLPNGVRIKLYVGNKFDNNDIVNIYSYIKDNGELSLVKNKIKVKNGYIEFNTVEASEYLITMSTIPNLKEIATTYSSNTNNISSFIQRIIIIVLMIIIMVIIIFILRRKKTNKIKLTNESIEDNTNLSVSENVNIDNNNINNIVNDYKSYSNEGMESLTTEYNSSVNNVSNESTIYNSENLNIDNNNEFNTVSYEYNDYNNQNIEKLNTEYYDSDQNSNNPFN